jgi:hypothetical protein
MQRRLLSVAVDADRNVLRAYLQTWQALTLHSQELKRLAQAWDDTKARRTLARAFSFWRESKSRGEKGWLLSEKHAGLTVRAAWNDWTLAL